MQSARLVWVEGEALDIGRDMRSGGVTGIHPAKEGYLYLSANTARFFGRPCADSPAWTPWPTIRAMPASSCAPSTPAAILPRLHEALQAHTAMQWEEIFGDAVPCAARKIEDMFQHPQVHAEQMIGEVAHPVVGKYQNVTRPIVYGRTPRPRTLRRADAGAGQCVALIRRGRGSRLSR